MSAELAHRNDVPVERTTKDLHRLAIASLLEGAVARYRRAVERGDELAQIRALTELDSLKNQISAWSL